MRTPSAASCAKLIGIVARATPLGPKATLAQLLITQTALELLAELREFYGSFRIALPVSNSAPTPDNLDVATLRAALAKPRCAVSDEQRRMEILVLDLATANRAAVTSERIHYPLGNLFKNSLRS